LAGSLFDSSDLVHLMKDFFGILRLAAYLLALPLIATAAASANQWASDTTPIVGPELLVAEGVETSTAPAPLPLQDHVVAKNDAGEVVGQVAIYDRSQLRTGLRNLTIYFGRNPHRPRGWFPGG
jgi:hypothetical protein